MCEGTYDKAQLYYQKALEVQPFDAVRYSLPLQILHVL